MALEEEPELAGEFGAESGDGLDFLHGGPFEAGQGAEVIHQHCAPHLPQSGEVPQNGFADFL